MPITEAFRRRMEEALWNLNRKQVSKHADLVTANIGIPADPGVVGLLIIKHEPENGACKACTDGLARVFSDSMSWPCPTIRTIAQVLGVELGEDA